MPRFVFLFFLLFGSFPGHATDDTAWTFKTGGRVYSTPLIIGGAVYFGSGDQHFYALEKQTGVLKWSIKTEGPVHSSATVSGDLLYFGSADGALYAVDRNTGKLAWKFNSNGERMNGLWDYYQSSPAVVDELVYWGSGDGHLYAVDAASGALKWKFDTGDIVHASPVVSGDKVFIGGFDGHMYAFNKRDGSLDWKFKTVGASYFPKGEIQRAALVENDTVYFGSRDYNIYALDANTGRGKWNMKQPRGWIIATPVEHEGNIFFGTSDAHIFYSMNKESGEVNWTIPLNMRVYGSAVIYGDLVYFGTFDGKLLGVDQETGVTKWQFETPSSRKNYHTVYDENGHFKEGFVLYGADYQTPERMIHSLGSILSSPVIDDGLIYFGSSDGHLYAVKLQR